MPKKPRPRRIHSKRLGEQAEAAFLNRAIGLGFAVATPWGNCERYDFIVDAGGRFWRIQVKSTRHQDCKRYGYPFKAHSFDGQRRPVPYREDEVDILAAYVAPEDLWYLIPIGLLKSHLTFRIYTYGRRGGHILDTFREAWWLLEGKKSAPPQLREHP